MLEENARVTSLVGGADDGRHGAARSVALPLRGRYEIPFDGRDLAVGPRDAIGRMTVICRMTKAEKPPTCRQSIIERAAGVF